MYLIRMSDLEGLPAYRSLVNQPDLNLSNEKRKREVFKGVRIYEYKPGITNGQY